MTYQSFIQGFKSVTHMGSDFSNEVQTFFNILSEVYLPDELYFRLNTPS